eukprot:s1898_g1.t1
MAVVLWCESCLGQACERRCLAARVAERCLGKVCKRVRVAARFALELLQELLWKGLRIALCRCKGCLGKACGKRACGEVCTAGQCEGHGDKAGSTPPVVKAGDAVPGHLQPSSQHFAVPRGEDATRVSTGAAMRHLTYGLSGSRIYTNEKKIQGLAIRQGRNTMILHRLEANFWFLGASYRWDPTLRKGELMATSPIFEPKIRRKRRKARRKGVQELKQERLSRLSDEIAS